MVHSIFLYQVAIDLKIEHLTLEIAFLLTQPKKYTVRLYFYKAVQEHCEKPAGVVLLSVCHAVLKFGDHSHSSSCYQQETSHLLEVCLKLLSSLKTYT